MSQRQSVPVVMTAYMANFVYYWVWWQPEFNLRDWWFEKEITTQVYPNWPGVICGC